MVKYVKPKASREAFQRVIDIIRDGELEFHDDDSNSNSNGDHQIADLEAHHDLEDTKESAAMLTSMRADSI